MPMQLYFKRAKCFVQSDDNGTKKFLAQPTNGPQAVPFWVANTPTFKQGIKDQSIVNLTPPEQMPGYKPAPAPVVDEVEPTTEIEPDPEPAKAEVVDIDADDYTQTEVPQASFGAQPMTPVTPAPKIGKVRAGNSR
jgi:hypothetical protein